jgi:hypothetical protein
MGITKLDALRDLFDGHTWKSPGLEPAGQQATRRRVTSRR